MDNVAPWSTGPKAGQASPQLLLRKRDPSRLVLPRGRASVAGRGFTPHDHRSEPKISIVEPARPVEPSTVEERLLFGIGPGSEPAERGGDIESLSSVALDSKKNRVRHARRQLTELRQQLSTVSGRSRQSAQPRHFEIEGPPAPERGREVRPHPPGPVCLEGHLDPPIHQQKMRGLQLCAHIQLRLWVGGATQLLSDLGTMHLAEFAEPRRTGQPIGQLLGHLSIRRAVQEIADQPLNSGARSYRPRHVAQPTGL
jgi:hypothetical protein